MTGCCIPPSPAAAPLDSTPGLLSRHRLLPTCSDIQNYSFLCLSLLLPSFTSGIPVHGNLTILATIEPAKPLGRIVDTYPAIEHTIKVVSLASLAQGFARMYWSAQRGFQLETRFNARVIVVVAQ